MVGPRQPGFDPIAILQALDRRRVAYIIIGALARVIEGTDEVTAGIDIVPSMREENLRRLEGALEDLNARRRDGKKLDLEASTLTDKAALEVDTDYGELKVVPEPEGTRGYDDLRRAAVREPLGQGLRPSVASPGDLARMLGALGRESDAERLRTLHRVIELERSLGLGLEV
ncbi:MAG: hypothetical protein M3327_00070 [Actinomycetota bacterium]|nr:hypothetical protein [Actinomycetota bacterium]